MFLILSVRSAIAIRITRTSSTNAKNIFLMASDCCRVFELIGKFKILFEIKINLLVFSPKRFLISSIDKVKMSKG